MEILHAGTQPIHTDRLLLRRFEPEDARSMFANWIHDEDVQGNYGEPACADLESVASLLRYGSKIIRSAISTDGRSYERTGMKTSGKSPSATMTSGTTSPTSNTA